ncbi:hypothetical protein [Ewingella americana]|uniref:Uncharacterized protein n=1 Tax=Ewingella americana TaxID=41202 RepID=A0A502GDR3_9GAMM|nr:hypothetical protein [Ewingella americana]TPG60004.1 hypothetical protein EAH77_15670 [Ewingella americana]
MKTDGFFIQKETFLNYTSATQKEILSSLGLDTLIDAEEDMDISREQLTKLVHLLTSQNKLKLVEFMTNIGKKANQVCRIKFLALDLTMSEEDVRNSLVSLNTVVDQEIPGKLFAEMSGKEDIVYISKTTLHSIRKTMTKRVRWHLFGKRRG